MAPPLNISTINSGGVDHDSKKILYSEIENLKVFEQLYTLSYIEERLLL